MSDITIPIQTQAEEFYVPKRNGVEKALRELQDEGYQALYMPELIDARTQANADSPLWQHWYTTPSMIATGKTNRGSPVVVYAHTRNHLSDPDNIAQAVQNHERGAGPIPQKEFQRLVDMDGMTDEHGNRRVWVIEDYKTLRNSESNVIPLKHAIEHPQTIPFLGGEQRAQKYLDRHKEIYGKKIGVWHTDDLTDQPMGRLLFLGGGNSDLNSDVNLDNSGRFLGVRAEGAAPKNEGPTPDQLKRIIGEYVAPVNREEARERIQALYD